MKKSIKIILVILIVLIICWGLMFLTDYIRCSKIQMPIFVVAGETADDGGSGTYYGLGYRVEVEKRLSAEYGVQIGKIEMYVFDTCVVGGIVEFADEGIVKIADGKIYNEDLIDEFITKTSEKQECELNIKQDNDNIQIVYVPSNAETNWDYPETTEDYQKIYGYYKLIINSEEKGKYDTLRWTIKRMTEDGIVRLYFDSATIDTVKIPIICEYNLDEASYKQIFKLTYNQRKDLGIKTIIDKNSSHDYQFNVYTFGGDVSITIDTNKVYDLKTALEQNIITVEDILEQVKQDTKYGMCEEGLYLDGGSIEYRYLDYTILKYNDLDGHKDLVIGMKGQIINQVNKILYMK